MDRERLKDSFDQQASSYDEKWTRVAAFRDSLHLLVGAAFKRLPADARVLCVGAGTGAEVLALAHRFPGWTFTAVEPSAGMLDVCRRRASESGIAARCSFHEGYLDALPATAPFDAATCLLVSQFILDANSRTDFFRAIAGRVRPGGLLVSADLSADLNSDTYPALLDVWLQTIAGPDITAEGLERMLAAYRRDVAVLPPADVEAILARAGFETPVPIFQAGLIRAWLATRAASSDHQPPP